MLRAALLIFLLASCLPAGAATSGAYPQYGASVRIRNHTIYDIAVYQMPGHLLLKRIGSGESACVRLHTTQGEITMVADPLGKTQPIFSPSFSAGTSLGWEWEIQTDLQLIAGDLTPKRPACVARFA